VRLSNEYFKKFYAHSISRFNSYHFLLVLLVLLLLSHRARLRILSKWRHLRQALKTLYVASCLEEFAMASSTSREERLQIMLSPEELAALDDFRFRSRMPSRAAAVRELLRRGLAAEGFNVAATGAKSSDFGVVGDGPEAA
jgi:hypothetical protein